MLGRGDFVQNIVRKKRSLGSRKRRLFVGKDNGSGNYVGVPPGFPPNLVESLTFGKFCDVGSKTKTRMVDEFYDDVHYENSVHDCSQMTKHNTFDPSIYVSKDNTEFSVGSLEESFKDANGRKEAKMSSDRVCSSETNGKSCPYAIRNKGSSSNEATAAQVEAKETVEEKEREENDHEVVVLLKEQNLKIQEELARLARQQEEMLQLMELREKRNEELRQLLTNFLRNQQPPPSSS
jgi:hypothetical protein